MSETRSFSTWQPLATTSSSVALIDRRHDQAGALRFAIRSGQMIERLLVVALRAFDLERHQLLEILGLARIQNVRAVTPNCCSSSIGR